MKERIEQTSRHIGIISQGALKTLVEDTERNLIEKIQKLIAEEIVIAITEGEKTSRLTSLSMKIKNI